MIQYESTEHIPIDFVFLSLRVPSPCTVDPCKTYDYHIFVATTLRDTHTNSPGHITKTKMLTVSEFVFGFSVCRRCR